MIVSFSGGQQPVAVICYAPWKLVFAGIAAGRVMTNVELRWPRWMRTSLRPRRRVMPSPRVLHSQPAEASFVAVGLQARFQPLTSR
ncbi:MAG: hypothetical protein ACHQ4H_13040 [Ktedonobacterales bacterium]